MKKYDINEVDLRRMYHDEKLTHKQIAAYYGCSVHNIGRLIIKFGLTLSSSDKKGRWEAWNKGLTKETSEQLAKISEDRMADKNPMFGGVPWNKGLTAETNETIRSISERRIGMKFTDESRAKMSEQAKRLWKETPETRGMSGRRHSEESKQKNREATISRIRNGEFHKIFSKPHQKVAEYVMEIAIGYEIEAKSGAHRFDLGNIEQRKFIEVHGDYFHRNPDCEYIMKKPINKVQIQNAIYDEIKKMYVKSIRGQLLVLWENDINNNWESVMLLIDEFIEERCHAVA